MASSSSHPYPFSASAARPANRVPSNASSSNASSASSSYTKQQQQQQHWAADSNMPEPFTPEMRDLQARGKDPYSNGADLGGGGGGGGGRGSGGLHHHHHHHHHHQHGGGEMRMGGSRQHHHQQPQQPKEPFQKTERRDWAETVLDNPELLLMYAQSSGDTLPATRHKFKKIMCGLDYDDEDDDASVTYQQQQQQQQQHQHQQQQQQQSRFNGAGAWAHDGGGARGGRR